MINKTFFIVLIVLILVPISLGQVLNDNYATELLIIKGEVLNNTINSTWTDDNNSLLLAETAGAPGFQYLIYFENVLGVTPSLEYKLRYLAGGGSHIVDLLIYDFDNDNFTYLKTIPINSSWQTGQLDISSVGRGTSVILKFDHEASGNTNHLLEIDYLNVKSITPTDVSETSFFHVELENNVYIAMIIIMLIVGGLLSLTTFNLMGALVIMITGFVIIVNTSTLFGIIILITGILLIFKPET